MVDPPDKEVGLVHHFLKSQICGKCVLQTHKTVKLNKNEKSYNGVWLGFIDLTNEHLIGTPMGTIKCRAIREPFRADLIEIRKGTPWEPVPGRNNFKVLTNT